MIADFVPFSSKWKAETAMRVENLAVADMALRVGTKLAGVPGRVEKT